MTRVLARSPAIAVAMRRPVLGRRRVLGADPHWDLELHHLPRDGLDRFADHISVLIEQHFLTTSSIVILSAPAARRLLSSSREKPDDFRAVSAGTSYRPTPTYTTLRDATRTGPLRPATAIRVGKRV